MTLGTAAATASPPDADGFVALAPLDLPRTLAPLAHGSGDPTLRFTPDGIWRVTRTDQGPATLRLRPTQDGVSVQAWGPGAAAAVAGAPDLVGAADALDAFQPEHPLLADLVRRFPGLRLPYTHRPFEALLPAICEQKVTGVEARAAYRAIVRRYGEPAPGPIALAGRPLLRTPPDPALLAHVPYFAFHRLGLERRRAELVRRAAQLAPRLDALTPQAARARMAAVPGIGPWTLAEVCRVAYGDPDAVSVGDYHVPNMVAWALAGERRADDARMLELLEPYRGQRGRVQLLLEAARIFPPRRGPRMAPREFRDQ